MRGKIWLCVLTIFFNTGCASSFHIMNELGQPDKKDVCLLKKGASRSLIIAELGPPVKSELKESKNIEIFEFPLGTSSTEKLLVGAFGIPLYLLTGGIYMDMFLVMSGEINNIKTEYYQKREDEYFRVELSYDEENNIDQIKFLKNPIGKYCEFWDKTDPQEEHLPSEVVSYL